MPIYDYECRKCGRRFELRRGFEEGNGACCPHCEGEAHRIFTAVPVIFKGSGFYVTDHQRPNPVSGGEKEEKPKTKPSEEKTATKLSEKKSEAKTADK